MMVCLVDFRYRFPHIRQVSSWRHQIKTHDNVIKWKHFPRYWPACGKYTGHRWFRTQSRSRWHHCVTGGTTGHRLMTPFLDISEKKCNSDFLAATKQLYDWFSPSVCPSVCLSVTPFSPCSHHRIIMKFSGVITMVRSDVHAKGQGQRSKGKVTEVNIQLSRFRTLTPVWIHIWQWNHAHSWKQHRRGALLFFKVIRQISRSHGSKNRRIWPRLGVSGL